MDTGREAVFKIATISLGVLSGIMGVVLILSFVVMWRVHKEVMILKARHLHIDTKPNESYAVFKGTRLWSLPFLFRISSSFSTTNSFSLANLNILWLYMMSL